METSSNVNDFWLEWIAWVILSMESIPSFKGLLGNGQGWIGRARGGGREGDVSVCNFSCHMPGVRHCRN